MEAKGRVSVNQKKKKKRRRRRDANPTQLNLRRRPSPKDLMTTVRYIFSSSKIHRKKERPLYHKMILMFLVLP